MDNPNGGKLGMGGLPPHVQEVLKVARESQSDRYRLTWRGSKIPRGAKVGGLAIAWTQNGTVHVEGGDIVGYYKRETEFGGAAGDEHVMVISTSFGEVTGGDGMTVEKL